MSSNRIGCSTVRFLFNGTDTERGFDFYIKYTRCDRVYLSIYTIFSVSDDNLCFEIFYLNTKTFESASNDLEFSQISKENKTNWYYVESTTTRVFIDSQSFEICRFTYL